MIRKEIWSAIDSDEGFAILDSTLAAGSDWSEGGCAILAFALLPILVASYGADRCYVVVIYDRSIQLVHHFGVWCNGIVVDGAGVHDREYGWIESFVAAYSELQKDSLEVLAYSVAMNTSDIVIDPVATDKLTSLIENKINGAF